LALPGSPGNLSLFRQPGSADRGIQQHSSRTNANQAPIVPSGHRIDESVPQETPVSGVFELFDPRRIPSVSTEEEFDSPLVLFAAFDQQLLLLAAPLECHTRQFCVDGNCHYGGHYEHYEETNSGLAPVTSLSLKQ
jgi:hypothetical protein